MDADIHKAHMDRLKILKSRAALQGMNTPPEVIIEIRHIEKELGIASSSSYLEHERMYDCGHRIRQVREEIGLTTSEFIELINFRSERAFSLIESRHYLPFPTKQVSWSNG